MPANAVVAHPLTLLLSLLGSHIIFVCQPSDHIQCLAHELLLDGLQAAVLLEHLTRHVERKRVGVDQTLEGKREGEGRGGEGREGQGGKGGCMGHANEG